MRQSLRFNYIKVSQLSFALWNQITLQLASTEWMKLITRLCNTLKHLVGVQQCNQGLLNHVSNNIKVMHNVCILHKRMWILAPSFFSRILKICFDIQLGLHSQPVSYLGQQYNEDYRKSLLLVFPKRLRISSHEKSFQY